MTSSDSSPLDDLMPRDPIMAMSWVGSVRYALGRTDVMAAFRTDTGNLWGPGRTPLDRLIDEVAGAELAFIRAFAKWHNEFIWGMEAGKPVDAV